MKMTLRVCLFACAVVCVSVSSITLKSGKAAGDVKASARANAPQTAATPQTSATPQRDEKLWKRALARRVKS